MGTDDQIEVMLAIEFFYNIRPWNTDNTDHAQWPWIPQAKIRNPPKVNDTPRSLSAHPLHELGQDENHCISSVRAKTIVDYSTVSNMKVAMRRPDIGVRVGPKNIAEETRIRHISWTENPVNIKISNWQGSWKISSNSNLRICSMELRSGESPPEHHGMRIGHTSAAKMAWITVYAENLVVNNRGDGKAVEDHVERLGGPNRNKSQRCAPPIEN
jgi:hypothetical protein